MPFNKSRSMFKWCCSTFDSERIYEKKYYLGGRALLIRCNNFFISHQDERRWFPIVYVFYERRKKFPNILIMISSAEFCFGLGLLMFMRILCKDEIWGYDYYNVNWINLDVDIHRSRNSHLYTFSRFVSVFFLRIFSSSTNKFESKES